MKKQRLFTRYFIILCLLGFASSVTMKLLDNTLAIYADDLWGSKSYGGALTTTFTIGSVAVSLFAGRLIDRSGRQRAFIAGSVVFTVVTLGCVVFTQPWIVLAIRVLQGGARAVAAISAASMAADNIPVGRMGEGMGYYGLGNTLASAFGPALGILLISGGSYSVMFTSCVAISAVQCVLALFMNYEKKGGLPPLPTPAAGTAAPGYKGIWRMFEKGALPSAVINFTVSAADVCILVFLTLYAQEVLGTANAGTFFTLSAVGMLLAKLFGGKVVDRIGALPLMCPAIVLSMLIYLSLSYIASNYIVFLITGFCYGLAQGSMCPAINAIAMIDSPAERRNAANATLNFGMDLGILIFSAVMGVVVDAAGFKTMFGIGTALYAVSLALAAVLYSNSARSRHRERLGIGAPQAERPGA